MQTLNKMSLGTPVRQGAYYVVLLSGVVSISLFVLARGSTSAGVRGSLSSNKIDFLLPFLLAVAVIILGSRILGSFATKVGQPRVVGEILAGIVIGPTALGRVSSATYSFLFPSNVTEGLSLISQLGIVLFMFGVGFHVDLKRLKKESSATLIISHSSIAMPFLIGMLLAFKLFPAFHGQSSFAAFALFLSVCLSITAFPVLARLLKEMSLDGSSLGRTALASAAIDDMTAWCLLALALSVADSAPLVAVRTTGLAIGLVAAFLWPLRPALALGLSQFEGSKLYTKELGIGLVVVATLVAAFLSEFIGIHAIFGAFLLGVVLPKDSKAGTQAFLSLETIVGVVLLPLFFAFTGLRVQLGLVATAHDWFICALVIAGATAGKVFGTYVGAKTCGFSNTLSLALGALLNTRGLVELVALNIGLDRGLISQSLFTILVLMALVTTAATTPIMDLLLPKGRRALLAP